MTPAPKIRYELRRKGTPYILPMEIIEVSSHQEAIDVARKRLFDLFVTEDRPLKTTRVKFGVITSVELKRID